MLIFPWVVSNLLEILLVLIPLSICQPSTILCPHWYLRLLFLKHDVKHCHINLKPCYMTPHCYITGFLCYIYANIFFRHFHNVISVMLVMIVIYQKACCIIILFYYVIKRTKIFLQYEKRNNIVALFSFFLCNKM